MRANCRQAFAHTLMFGRYLELRHPYHWQEGATALMFDRLFYQAREMLDQCQRPWTERGQQFAPTAAELAAFLLETAGLGQAHLHVVLATRPTLWVVPAAVGESVRVALEADLPAEAPAAISANDVAALLAFDVPRSRALVTAINDALGVANEAVVAAALASTPPGDPLEPTSQRMAALRWLRAGAYEVQGEKVLT